MKRLIGLSLTLVLLLSTVAFAEPYEIASMNMTVELPEGLQVIELLDESEGADEGMTIAILGDTDDYTESSLMYVFIGIQADVLAEMNATLEALSAEDSEDASDDEDDDVDMLGTAAAFAMLGYGMVSLDEETEDDTTMEYITDASGAKVLEIHSQAGKVYGRTANLGDHEVCLIAYAKDAPLTDAQLEDFEAFLASATMD